MGAIIAAALVLVAGQVFAKLGALSVPDRGWVNGFLALSYTALIIRGALWLYVLRRFPLSFAYPLLGSAYLVVPVVAVFAFGESFSVLKGAGVCLIFIGILFLASDANACRPRTSVRSARDERFSGSGT